MSQKKRGLLGDERVKESWAGKTGADVHSLWERYREGLSTLCYPKKSLCKKLADFFGEFCIKEDEQIPSFLSDEGRCLFFPSSPFLPCLSLSLSFPVPSFSSPLAHMKPLSAPPRSLFFRTERQVDSHIRKGNGIAAHSGIYLGQIGISGGIKTASCRTHEKGIISRRQCGWNMRERG